MSPDADSTAVLDPTSDITRGADASHRHRSKAPRKKGTGRTKSGSVSVRFPRDLYQHVANIALQTDQPLSAVLDQGIHYYFQQYVRKSSDFAQRASTQQISRDEALSRLRGAGPATTSARRETAAAAIDPPVSLTPPIMVRVDQLLEDSLHDLQDALGLSPTEAVIEATQRWVDLYPTTARYRDRAKAALEARIQSLKDYGQADLVAEVMNAHCECGSSKSRLSGSNGD